MPEPTPTDKPVLCCSTSFPAKPWLPIVTSPSFVSLTGLDQIYKSINYKRGEISVPVNHGDGHSRVAEPPKATTHQSTVRAGQPIHCQPLERLKSLEHIFLGAMILEVQFLPLMRRVCFKLLNPPLPLSPQCGRPARVFARLADRTACMNIGRCESFYVHLFGLSLSSLWFERSLRLFLEAVL